MGSQPAFGGREQTGTGEPPDWGGVALVALPRFLNVTYILAFILGFLLCAALCWKRLRESRRAFIAASERNAIFEERERRRREGLSKVFARASEIKNILGGTVTLPAAARTQAGQRVQLRITTQLTGPSVNGGPDF